MKIKNLILILIVGYSCSHQKHFPTREAASEKADYPRRTIFAEYQFPQDQKKVKVAFFDADSTLRVSTSGIVTANEADDVYILPCVAERLSSLAEAGYLIAIVSNQGGVPKMPHSTAAAALMTTARLIYEKGGEVHYYDYAAKDDAENDRKPGIGMALRLEEMLKKLGYELDKESSFMVGDSAYKKDVDTKPDGSKGTHFSNADRLFAHHYFKDFEKSVVPFHFEEANVFFAWNKNGVDVFQTNEETGIHGIEIAKDYLKEFSVNACPEPDSKLH